MRSGAKKRPRGRGFEPGGDPRQHQNVVAEIPEQPVKSPEEYAQCVAWVASNPRVATRDATKKLLQARLKENSEKFWEEHRRVVVGQAAVAIPKAAEAGPTPAVPW